MNRENLWRGKDQFGNWVYGTYYKHITRTPSPIGDSIKPEDIQHLIIRDGFSDWNLPRGIELIEVDGDTVGQYTWTRDKSGKRIFEGDYLGDKSNVVEFINGCFYFAGSELTIGVPSPWEVIGNIYDNYEELQEEMRKYYDGNI